jgi:hypothetical protein
MPAFFVCFAYGNAGRFGYTKGIAPYHLQESHPTRMIQRTSVWPSVPTPQRLLYVILTVLGLASLCLVWASSPGTPADDEITHAIVTLEAWQAPELLLDIWMRFANSLLFFLPSLGGLNGLRAASVVLTLLTLVFSTSMASKLGLRRLYLVPLFFCFQPWVLNLGFTAIKSVPFMFLLAWAGALWLSKRPLWAAFIFGFVPLSRHEGIALLGLWCLYMLVSRQWRAALLCWLPTLLYNGLFWLHYRASWEYLPFAVYFRPRGSDFYGSGTAWHYLLPTLASIGAVVCFLAVFGLLPALKQGHKAIFLLLYPAYFVLHTIIYMLGFYESGGYVMFLLALATPAAILAALGLEQGLRLLAKQQRLANGLIGVVALLAIGWGWLNLKPILNNDAENAARTGVAWLRRELAPNPADVWSTYPWVYLFYPEGFSPPKKWFNSTQMAAWPAGTIFIWDAKYSEGLGFARNLFEAPAWQTLHQINCENDSPCLIVYGKLP